MYLFELFQAVGRRETSKDAFGLETTFFLHWFWQKITIEKQEFERFEQKIELTQIDFLRNLYTYFIIDDESRFTNAFKSEITS